MIYITVDARDPHNKIHYEQVLSNKKAPLTTGSYIKLKLWNIILKKYQKQKVWIIPDIMPYEKPIYGVYKIIPRLESEVGEVDGSYNA